MRRRAFLASLLLCIAVVSAQSVQFKRGDTNLDRGIDISDAVRLLVALFGQGPALPCPDAADANDSGELDIADAVYILGYLFAHAAPPPPPFAVTACDPTADALTCGSYPGNAPCDAPTPDMIFGHAHTSLSVIPEASIQAAKTNLRLYFGHTSHGSQIMTGIDMLRSDLLDYNGGAGTLQIREGGGDLGNPDTTAWAATTRAQLNGATNDRNVVMWSWCGQLSWLDAATVQRDYLDNMQSLERDYPNVKFIYMTGHLDGTGPAGDLARNNELIRSFCRANGKTLFDFADIESYDPDGNYYLDLEANDNCDYVDPISSQTRNWAVDWCAAHPTECLSCNDCAHSQCLNCQRKGKVFWWMMARMAGWNGQ